MCIERNIDRLEELLDVYYSGGYEGQYTRLIGRLREKDTEGTVGLCDICHCPISRFDLEDQPLTTTCLGCGIKHSLFPWYIDDKGETLLDKVPLLVGALS